MVQVHLSTHLILAAGRTITAKVLKIHTQARCACDKNLFNCAKTTNIFGWGDIVLAFEAKMRSNNSNKEKKLPVMGVSFSRYYQSYALKSVTATKTIPEKTVAIAFKAILYIFASPFCAKKESINPITGVDIAK